TRIAHQKGITCHQSTAHQRFHTTTNGKHFDLSTALSRSTGKPVGFNGVPQEAERGSGVYMCTHCCPCGKKQHPHSHVCFSLQCLLAEPISPAAKTRTAPMPSCVSRDSKPRRHTTFY
ncbi:unnamed protein product, partial [Ectocarpus sp. 12 AP-2014]